jgi:glycosyltransferase involved in cell wall biosynthesis
MMHIAYVLLSSTFGMHQYTADLANRMAQLGHDVTLITTAKYPGHRYLPQVAVRRPVLVRNTGFSPDGLRLWAVRRAVRAVLEEQPDLVHVTGPHLWNPILLRTVRRAGIPTVHTLHDLDPHPGTAYGPLLHAWNRRILSLADHILVHGVRYEQRLLQQGHPEARLTCTPLMHLFLGHTWLSELDALAADVAYEPHVLFFGRMEKYKGVDHLITAWAMRERVTDGARLILAGMGDLDRVWSGPLPPHVEARNRLIEDDEAVELFRRCALLVLPYMGATQSALIPAAYFFHKPVMAAPSGALHEYVSHGETGWLVEPEHPPSLARALDAALSDWGRIAAMGRAGRAWYEARRAMETQALREMYHRLF